MSKDTKTYRSCHPSVATRRWELGLFRGQKSDPWLFCHPPRLKQILLWGCATDGNGGKKTRRRNLLSGNEER